MRLTCPNCTAQYEVDDRVIPQNGRDVQCSACGNTWYQYPMEVALQMRAADMDDDEDDDRPVPPPVDGTARNTAPRIDKTVLDVLREEAEREMSERRRSRGDLQTQGDLGLTRPQRSRAAPSRIHGEEDTPPPPPPPDLSDLHGESARQPARKRNVLPDIEELTSTLEPGNDSRAVHNDDTDESAAAQPGGFRNGLSLVALVGMALVAVYLLAPMIASYVPASEGVLITYVGLVNDLRAWVAGMLRGLFGG